MERIEVFRTYRKELVMDGEVLENTKTFYEITNRTELENLIIENKKIEPKEHIEKIRYLYQDKEWETPAEIFMDYIKSIDIDILCEIKIYFIGYGIDENGETTLETIILEFEKNEEKRYERIR